MNPRLRSVLKFLGWSAAVVAVLAFAGLIAAKVLYSRYEQRAAQFDLTRIDEVAERSAVYDVNGELYSYYGGENRLVVPLTSVSKHFLEALLAREDARFWHHEGIDFRGVVRAFVTNVRSGETKQGASTITQQLARNACELKARNLDRKALEAVLARRIEATYRKDQILELYVNRIYFGSGFHGIETAARGYFGKPAGELTLGEGAVLAGLIRSPNRFSPARDPEAARVERDTVLDRMLELKMITADDAVAAKAQRVQVASRDTLHAANDYVMDAVLREVSSRLAPETIDRGGLKIYATIDPQLQRLAQAAADRHLTEIEGGKNFPHPKKKDFTPGEDEANPKPTDYLQAAVVAVDNRTGAVRAIVGGRDHAHSKYSRALLSKRQVGSTFKPFVYSAAFERGLLPGTMIDDSKILPGELRNVSNKWSPENSDGEYAGLQPAAFGLLKSRNTMSVRIGEYAGLPKVRELAVAAGIGENVPDLPVSFLGAFETTLKDITAAYAAFANLGVHRAPYLIARVEDREGRTLWKAEEAEKRIMSAETAWMVSAILQQVMKTGTAAKAGTMGWKKPGAGKTGTTNDFFDAWFIGYTSSLTCGVWVGMDQPQTILEKGYGSTLALPIWVDFMQQVPEKMYPAQAFAPPAQLIKARLCSVSGARATASCAAQNCAYDAELPNGRVPVATCQTHPDLPPVQSFATTMTPSMGAPVATPGAVGAPTAASSVAPAPMSAAPAPVPIIATPINASADPRLAPSAVAIPNPPPQAPANQYPGTMRIERTAEGTRIRHWPAGESQALPPENVPVRRAEMVAPAPSAVEPRVVRVEPAPRVMRALPVEARSVAPPRPREMPPASREIRRVVPADAEEERGEPRSRPIRAERSPDAPRRSRVIEKVRVLPAPAAVEE
ncbi:MAG TPA: PBP1A family penicillin-binding protein [Chthoniobacteraceae bacterium]|nr:PBP1A family penicillin-binding protein [Chthoniobacteraceae bacterium]